MSASSGNGSGIMGISDHGGWAVLVTATSAGVLLDRRRVPLLAADLPALPYHHDAQGLPLPDAVELIERVRVSAEEHAGFAFDAVAGLGLPILGVALRQCPPLPATIAERLRDYRSQNVADWVMYRRALALAAAARGWPVHWYDSKTVVAAAGLALGVQSLDAHFAAVRKAAGPPWGMDHKLAMSAAIASGAGMVPTEEPVPRPRKSLHS